MEKTLSELTHEELINILSKEMGHLANKYHIKRGFELEKDEVNQEMVDHYLGQFRKYSMLKMKLINSTNKEEIMNAINECRAIEEKMKMEFLNIVPPKIKKFF